jgi:hypothetical protein
VEALMSNWIESHQALANHPKTLKAMRLLGVDKPTMVGYLHLLWWWALDYAPEGDLSKYEDADLADAACYQGDPHRFVSALVNCGIGADGKGFIDASDTSGRYLHDWHDYAGKMIERRKANAKRMREARAEHVQNTSGARVKRHTYIHTNKPYAPAAQLAELAFECMPESESTKDDYEKLIERRLLAGFSEDQLRRLIVTCADWCADNGEKIRDRKQLHRTLQTFIGKEKPEPPKKRSGYESPPVPDSWRTDVFGASDDSGGAE